MNRRLFILAAFSLAIDSGPLLHAEEKPAKAVRTVRLLNFGNSFSGNATQYLGAITKAAGQTAHAAVENAAAIATARKQAPGG